MSFFRILEGRQRKYERDVRILGEELEARPEHPFVLFNLGVLQETLGNIQDATRCLNDAVKEFPDREGKSGESGGESGGTQPFFA